jgi:hypothetical protein
MSGTMPAPPPFRPDPLARVGLLGSHTMLSRRAGRSELTPSGPAGGPTTFRSDQFGFVARLPTGWVRQSGEAVTVHPYGIIEMQDLEVLTPTGGHVRIGLAVEPLDPSEGAMDRLARIFLEWTGGDLVDVDPPSSECIWRELLITDAEGALIMARLFICGRRVACVEVRHDPDAEPDDDAMRAVLDAFEMVPCPRIDGRSSGTYRIRVNNPTPAFARRG